MIVGSFVSIIDAGILYILMYFGLHAYIGRIFSYISAMTCGYFFNRFFTFQHLQTSRSIHHSMLRHYTVHGIGGLLNYGVFVVMISFSGLLRAEGFSFSWLPLFAVWTGGIIGIGFNYIFATKLVWNK